MANAGIKSTQAGTSLRTIMTNLSGDVKICGANIGEVAVATTNADGSMRDLSDILADCRTAFSGLSESEKAAAAESLVGENAMSGFLALMNAGEADISKLSSAITNCDGTAEGMANTMQDNLAGQLQILKSQLEELAISFGDLLMPAIRSIVGWIQKFVDWLNSMDEGTRKVIVTVALKAFFKAAWEAIKTTVTTVWNAIKDFFTGLWDGIKNAVSNAANAIKTGVSNAFNAMLNGIKNVCGNIYGAVKGGFDKAANFVKNLASEAFQWGADFIGGIVNGIKSMIGKVGDAVSSVADKIRSFLHFSVPDEGPLTDYESWMPDFIGGLAKGIEKSRGMIENAMNGVTSDLTITPRVMAAQQRMNLRSGCRNFRLIRSRQASRWDIWTQRP